MELTLLEATATLERWLHEWSTGGATSAGSDDRARRAVRALAALGDAARPAVPRLVRAMHADPRGLGEVVGQALGGIGGEPAIRELNRAWFSGWDRKLCEACYGALVQLGEQAHPILLRIAAEPDALERVKAVFSLRATGYREAALARLAVTMVNDAPLPLVDPLVELLGAFADQDAMATARDALRTIAGGELHFADTRRRAADAAARLQSR